MKKLILVVAGAIAAGSAGAVLGMGPSGADPSGNLANVTGEPYAKAVAILQAQGYKAVFGGAVGSEVPQAQCLVQSQKAIGGGGGSSPGNRQSPRMQLMLNCTKKAQESLDQGTGPAPGMGGGGARPTPGAPGVVTVTPTQVG